MIVLLLPAAHHLSFSFIFCCQALWSFFSNTLFQVTVFGCLLKCATCSIVNWKKPALTRVQKPTPALFIVPHDIQLWPFETKINESAELLVEHFCVTSVVIQQQCLRYHADKQTDRQTLP